MRIALHDLRRRMGMCLAEIATKEIAFRSLALVFRGSYCVALLLYVWTSSFHTAEFLSLEGSSQCIPFLCLHVHVTSYTAPPAVQSHGRVVIMLWDPGLIISHKIYVMDCSTREWKNEKNPMYLRMNRKYSPKKL
jgi:hypothetical protein